MTDESQLSASQRVLLALKQAKAKIETLERYRSEPIAVIGMGCRFPGAENPDRFWSMLENGEHAIDTMPADRFDLDSLYDPVPGKPGKIYTRKGGFLNQIDQFDPYFFKISPREAEGLDPQQRLVLEVAYEALQHARVAEQKEKMRLTGIFMGISQNDYAQYKLRANDLSRIDAYDGSGNLACFAAGRLGYVLGAQGPNLAIDTACSSSLVALHLACQSLRQKECDMALAGGVHLVLSPEITIFLCQTHVLSKDGLCKTFDASADGFSRGEGCGVVVLKRLSDAMAHKDNILAVILGSAVNHDGRSGGLTVPNEQAQTDLIRAALANAHIGPDDIDYIEAHGTGTALGDPIEVAALASVFGQKRQNPLAVGSVKTNIGHLEAAAGAAGLIKTILALNHGLIPAHLHFKTPNPQIPWHLLPITIPQTSQPFGENGKRPIAGISSFGMSGTNAHIILKAPEDTDALAKAGQITAAYQRERYWVMPAAAAGETDVKGAGHPLIGDKMLLPMSDDIRFEAVLTAKRPLYVKDHLVFNQMVVPAASHVVAILTAAKNAFGPGNLVLEEVIFSKPLVLADQCPRKVQIIFKPLQNNSFQFHLVSMALQGKDALPPFDDKWIEHASGRIYPNTGANTAYKDHFPNASGLFDRQMSADVFYRNLKQTGFDLKNSFQWIQFLKLNGQQVEASIDHYDRINDRSALESDLYPIHPGMLDSCFQILSFFWETLPQDMAGNPDNDAFLFVPFSIEKLHWYDRLGHDGHHICHAQSQKPNTGSLELVDQSGRNVLTVERFTFRKARFNAFETNKDHLMANAMYRLAWEPIRLQSTPKHTSQKFLIFDDHAKTNQTVIRELESMGHICKRADIETWQTQRFDADQIIWLMMGSPIESMPAQEFIKHQKVQYASVLKLIQSLLASDMSSIPKVNLVTDIGWADSGHPVLPHSAMIWGLGRTLVAEFPDFPVQLIDLDPGSPQNHARNLAQILTNQNPAWQIAFTGNSAMKACLTSEKTNSKSKFIFDDTENCIITGGVGGLGLFLAQMLAEQGCKHLVLCGRSAPSPEALAQIQHLENKGVRIKVASCDISDMAQIRQLIQETGQEMPTITGLFHAAGVIKDAMLPNQTRSHLETVMAAKVSGAWNLHLISQEMDLKWFVMFSSIAAVIGSSGQANYAAANAFMDALSKYRQDLGLPGLSINWGPFDKAGMAARLASGSSLSWQKSGLVSISPEKGMASIPQMLSSQSPQVCVLPGVSPEFISRFNHRSFDMDPQTQSVSLDAPAAILEELQQAPAQTQEQILKTHIIKRLAQVLKIKSLDRITDRQRLFDAGLDSMMAVELKNLLEQDFSQKLRATLVFDYPTVQALVGYLKPLLLNGHNRQKPASAGPDNSIDNQVDNQVENQIKDQITDVNVLVAEIDRMSEQDVLNQLMQKK